MAPRPLSQNGGRPRANRSTAASSGAAVTVRRLGKISIMQTAQLGLLDAGLVVLYLLSVMGIGLWMSLGVKSTKDFFLAGKSLPWWAVALSLVVSDIGAKDMVGVAADA